MCFSHGKRSVADRKSTRNPHKRFAHSPRSGLNALFAVITIIVTGAQKKDDVAWVGAESLIPMRAIAWLDLGARSMSGEAIDQRNIRKHLNDVARLTQLLLPKLRVEYPGGFRTTSIAYLT